MKAPVEIQYDEIADLYDILSAGDDGFMYFRHEAGKLLKDFPKTARLIDCACGTGKHAAWMASMGFEVYASDISEGMLERARNNVQKASQKAEFIHASWELLPEKTDKKFDVVFIPGNSISHVTSLEMLDNSFAAIKEIMLPEGKLLFDMRNWEKTFEEELLQTQRFTITRNRKKYDVGYAWDIKGWNKKSKMIVDIVAISEKDVREYVFDFFPLGYDQIYASLIHAGFENIEIGDSPDDDYYFVKAS